MRILAMAISFAALVPAAGQSSGSGAKDSADIMNFLVQSQIVEFRTNLARDPFAAPVEQIGQSHGLMMLDEITVKGRFVIKNKAYAIILDAMQNTQEIPVGFRFQDGEVTAITENAVIFDQWDPNSTNRSGKRSVTKYFKREEDK
jgi:hypothetical protein